MPLHRRLPKRGFTNIFKREWAEVNLADLEKFFEVGATVTPESLVEKGLILKSKAAAVVSGWPAETPPLRPMTGGRSAACVVALNVPTITVATAAAAIRRVWRIRTGRSVAKRSSCAGFDFQRPIDVLPVAIVHLRGLH